MASRRSQAGCNHGRPAISSNASIRASAETWLIEKSDAVYFQGQPFVGFIIAIASHEYDGYGATCIAEAPRKFNTGTPAELNVKDEADGLSPHRCIKKLFR